MADKNEYPEKYGWCISELSSLGINTNGKNEESADVQGLEKLTDGIKQNFIRNYKTCYSEKNNRSDVILSFVRL